ncbi:hypothetical protein PR202_gb08163 [Eleusine coracana subsp. coracana]|uniref:Protein kinase domain-containing protein n=1 Tax=Eleusine coracana subsp. coracana TaxID=191504 RepID=A0AAV5EF13_ELECO|nr:hypothetical protein PR202_gb08163 [Eleusine coracana subsp. coracana]
MRQVSVASRLRHHNLVRLLGYNITTDLCVLLYQFAPMGTLHDTLHFTNGFSSRGEDATNALAFSSDDDGKAHPAFSSSRLQAGAARARWGAAVQEQELRWLGLRREVAHGRLPKAGRSWPTLSWAQRVRVALDAANGLAYLHGAGVTHHDVRSTNVLLFEGFSAKIADYDMFKQLPVNDVESNFVFQVTGASRWFTTTGQVTQKGDVFCFGVVLLELLTGNKAKDSKLKLVVHHSAWLRFDPKLNRQYPQTGARKKVMQRQWAQ